MKESLRLYTLLAAAMMIVHFATLQNLLPWVDEVMFADTPMHFAKGMGWTTFAWYRGAQQAPFQTYQPLYALLLAGWMKLFGTSLHASRALNLAIAYLLGLALLRLMRSVGVRVSAVGIVVFTLMLWTADGLAWLIRCGRPDLLGALCAVVALEGVVRLLKSRRGARGGSDEGLLKSRRGARAGVVAGGAMTALASLPACVFLALVVVLSAFRYRCHRRQLLRALGLCIMGMSLGLLLTMVFMAIHGHLLAYLANVVAYSATLKRLAALALPYLAQPLGLDPAAVMPKLQSAQEASPAALMRALAIFRRPDYLVLLALSFRRKPTPLFLLSVGLPLLMSLAGRFERYYYWMALLPLLLQVTITISRQRPRLRTGVLAVVAVGIVLPGLHGLTTCSHAAEQRAFLTGLSTLKKRKVAAPFSVFYDLAPLTDSAYYAGVYPQEYLPADLDYIILPAASEYGSQKLQACCDSLRRHRAVEPVAECQPCGLRVFQVKPIHSK